MQTSVLHYNWSTLQKFLGYVIVSCVLLVDMREIFATGYKAKINYLIVL